MAASPVAAFGTVLSVLWPLVAPGAVLFVELPLVAPGAMLFVELPLVAPKALISGRMTGAAPDSVPRLGLAARTSDGRICLAAPDSAVSPGDTLTAVHLPDESDAEEGAALVFQVGQPVAGLCVPLWGLPGESDHLLTSVSQAPGRVGPGPLLVLLDRAWAFGSTPSGWALTDHRTERTLFARACASSEGLHLTLWDGAPLSGRRVWHRYFYLGYDVEPDCTEADYGGTEVGPPEPDPVRAGSYRGFP